MNFIQKHYNIQKKSWYKISENENFIINGVRLTVNGVGLLNNSVIDRNKLTEDEELELVEELDFGLNQPIQVPKNSIFYFTPEGLEKHYRLIELLTKAARGAVEYEYVKINKNDILWDSGDGQIAIKKDTIAFNTKNYKISQYNLEDRIYEKLDDMEYENSDEFLQDLKNSNLKFKIINLKNNTMIVFEYKNENYIVDINDLPLSLNVLEDWFYGLSDHELDYYVDIPEENFWDSVGKNDVLYHATNSENIESIKREGLIPDCKSRAISNRMMPCAVFMHPDFELVKSYGDIIISINIGKMKSDGFMPEVIFETGVEEARAKSILANLIGIDNFYIDEHINEGMSQGLSEETVAIKETIPPKYLNFEKLEKE